MNVLVTGATGAIGRLVVPKLLGAGHTVTAAGRSPGRLSALRDAGATPLQLDLFDADAAARAMRGHQAVVNLATKVPLGFKTFMPGAWRETSRIRRHASRALIDAALASGVERFVQESFAQTYPDRGDQWVDESTPIEPARYARAVAAAEASAERFTRNGAIGIALRFGFLYGPGDPFTQQLLDTVKGGWFPIFGSPDSYVSWVTHEDAASAVVAALQASAGSYNVVDDVPLTHREAGAVIAQVAGCPPPKFLPAWTAKLAGSLGATLARSVRISNAKLRATGWTPRYPSLADGLRAV